MSLLWESFGGNTEWPSVTEEFSKPDQLLVGERLPEHIGQFVIGVFL